MTVKISRRFKDTSVVLDAVTPKSVATSVIDIPHESGMDLWG